ncbi:MAG: hypothetical protein WBH01_10335 [Dehalococcoidia bacterium]
MRTDQHELGSVLYTLGNAHICEGGVCDKRESISWDEVDSLWLDAWHASMNYIPSGESLKVDVVSTTGAAVTLKRYGLIIRRKDRDNFWDLYRFIVSKIIDRQLSQLTRDLEQGTRVSFESFELGSTSIHREPDFGHYGVIDLHRVLGSSFENGEFFITFLDDKDNTRQVRRSLGHVKKIPNIHLAQAFLSAMAERNSG